MSASNKRPVAGSRSPARSKTDIDASRRMRMGLLGSTALIAASLAVSPAFAQIATPAGGGSISGSAAANDQTGAGGGVQISNATGNITVAGVTINNTTGAPTSDALRILGAAGLNTIGVTLTGVNTLTTTVNGGAALYVSGNANVGIGISSSGSTFTGSYGVNIQVPGGYVDFDARNQSQSFVANGTHIAGFNAVTSVNASIRLGSSTITGFDTGINSSNFYGSFVEMTGGSINALVTGIRTDATGGANNIQSQAAIVAPTGIHSTNTDTNGSAANVTTSGGGTINSTVNGLGTGIIATNSGGLNNLNVTVGAAIGGVTRHATGVNASTTGTATGIVNVATTAAISATGAGINMSSVSGATANVQGAIIASTGISSNVTGGATNITTSGAGTINAATANSGTGISATTNGSGAINVTVGAAIGGTTAFGRGVVISTANPSTAIINFHNTASITASTAGSTNSGLDITLWNPSGRSTIDIEADITGGRGVYTAGGRYDFFVRSGATVTAAATNGHGINSGNSTSTIDNAGVIRATGVGGFGAELYGLQSFTNSGTVEGAAIGLWLGNSTIVNNTGTIAGGTSGGIYGTGATVNNTGGTISGNWGIHADGNPNNITNSAGGLITGVVDAINLSANASGFLTNSATINTGGGAGSHAGVYLNRTLGSTFTITNTGTITGGADATLGYAVSVDDGATTITNNSGGQINSLSGLAGGNAIRLNSDDLATLNLNAGSIVNGGILSSNSGARTIALAAGASITGGYEASGGTGVDTITITGTGSIGGAVSVGGGNDVITLSSTGSIGGAVALGGGDDTFNWYGGTLGGTVNGGTQTATGDVFNSILGAGSGSLSLSNLSAFETYSHQSGTLTLTGSRNSGAVWNIATGTTLNLSGSLTNTTGSGQAITAAAGATVNVLGTGVLDNWVSLYFNGPATSTLTNSGSITGQSTAIFSTSGRVNITNNVGGTVSTSGASADVAIALASGGGTIINNGSVTAATTSGISSSNSGSGGSATSLTNGATGSVTGGSAGILMTGSGAFNVTNAGIISAGNIGTGFGIFQAAGTVTIANNSGGSITGNGYAVNTTGGSLVLTNASGATLSGGSAGSIQAATSGTATIDLQLGSTTTGDMILSGSGARTVTLAGAFNGNLDATGNSGAVNLTLNTSATGYTLLHAGSGADSLTFNGSGSRSFSVDNLSGWETGSFTGGAWTLTGTGNQNSFTSGLTVNGAALTVSNTQQFQGATGLTLTGGGSITTTASLTNTRTLNLTGAGTLGVASGQTLTQSGVVSGSGLLTLNGPGTVTLSGNNTYTGGTVVNAGILRLTHTSAAGTGVIHMIDPQIDFAATGTYNNDISLEVADGQQAADPTILNKTAPGSITLAGRIYETAGVGGANQHVTFTGGDIFLTNNLNSWGGVTTINNNTVFIQGGVNSLSGGSIVNNGALYYLNNIAGTVVQNISGSGAFQIGSTAPVTFAGNITTTGLFTVLNNAAAVIAGTRSGASVTGAVLSGSGSSLTVANGGSLLGGQYNGVRITGAGATVSNLGLIQNAGTGGDGTVGAGIYVLNGGAGGTTTVNNGSITDTGAGSTIQGRNAGVRHESGSTDLLVVNNYGLIVGDLYNAIENTAGGLTVNNFAGGYLATTLGNGISSNSGSAVSVTNAGVIGRNIAGNVTVNGYGVTTNGALTLNNQAGGAIYGTLGGVQTAAASASITNTGAIYGINGNAITLALGGAVVNGGSGLTAGQNTAALIDAGGTSGIAVTNGAFSLQNYGRIIAAGTGVQVGAGGAYVGAVTIDNAGLIQGSSSDGIRLNGAATVNNLAGGTITGSLSGIRLSGAYAYTLNLAAGSTVNGSIDASASSGANTTVLGGSLSGAYSGGSGIDTFTLGATGSMTSASLGAGADAFIYQGGAFSGLIDGGANTDSFTSALGAGSASVNLSNLTNFETFAHQSGTLTLTGTGAFSGGASVTGGSLVVDGALQSDASIDSGATLRGGGSITGAVSVANGGVLANTQGSTLTMGSLGLLSGSTINATFSGTGGPALFAVTGNLTLDGTVNVASTGAFGFGVYGLMTYGGVLTDNGLLIGAVPGTAQRMAVQTSVAGQVNIVHAPTELLFWDGGNGAQHDNGAVNGGAGAWTAAGSNWTDASGLSNGAMEPQPGFAIFQGAGGTVTVDNSLGAVGVTGMQFAANGYRIEGDALTLADANTTIRVGDGTAPSAAWTATIASALTGAGGLVKTDLGTLILAGDSDYTGGTTVNAGTLQIGDGATAGSIAGSVLLANNSTLVFSRNDNHDFANAVSGTGSVGVNGAVTLSGAITASGGVDVYSGGEATVSNVNVASGSAVTLASNSLVTVAAGGSVVSQNGAGVESLGSSVYNYGSIQGTAQGVLTSGGSVWNYGSASAISGVTGIHNSSPTFGVSVYNAGTVTGSLVALYSASGATLNNTGSGTMSGLYAVNVLGNLGMINAGSISASVTNFNNSAIYAGAAGTISNTGSITSGTNAIYTQGAGILTNSGLIRGGGAASTVRLVGGNSYVTNVAGGQITTTGTGGGIYLDGINGFVSNAGSISGGNAIQLISGGGIDNSGSLTGTVASGVVLAAGGTINNLATGSISGATNGVNAGNGAANMSNAGSISGTTGQGVLLQSGGTINNLATGSITGGQSGVRSLAALNLTSAGAISGSANAIESVGAFNDTLTFLAGSTTTGAVLTAAGNDVISLAGTLNGALNAGDGADTVTLIDTASFTSTLDGGADVDAFVLGGSGSGSLDIGTVLNFESRTKTGAGTWTLTGTDASTLAWALNSGVLAASGGSAINDAAFVNIAGGGTLALLNDETIGALTGSGFVNLGASRLTLAGAETTTYGGVISGSGGLTIGSGYGLSLSGANTATGATIVNGVLRLSAAGVLADASNLQINTGGIVELQGFDEAVNNALISGVLNGPGTLTAAQYQLNGGSVQANLGAGFLTSQGLSALNGTSGAATAIVTSGTLTLGASDRLSNAAIVGVSTGATLNLQAFNDTITTLDLNGTLAGTGTLTANTYFLRTGSVVDAKLGTGEVRVNGNTTLNGTAAAASVVINTGTLTLGASNRLADGATVFAATGSTLNLGAFNDTVSVALLNGTLAGTGTLTAGEYDLNGATINANLGAGNLFNTGGVSTLTGTSAAANVVVQAGTLNLGGSNRLADTAVVSIASGSTLNLGAFNDTVNLALLNGTLAGTGTLTAGEYDLNGATINANLGAGNLFNIGGVSTLNGLSGAGMVSVTGGTLTLGASNRLADAAQLSVSSGATLNLGAFNDTVTLALLNGTLAGTGTLTAGEYDLNGATINANLGAGNLFNIGGVSTLNGVSGAGQVSVTGGTLTLGASNRLADVAHLSVSSGATLNLGAFNDTVTLALLNGTLAGTGTLTAGQYALNGATITANLGAGDLFNTGGVSTLTGTSGAANVNVLAGTLGLGASNRLADTATVSVAAGSILNLNAFNDTVGLAVINGTLNGTGTLTAAQYQLNAATVNANLGAGTLFNLGGVSTLNGTAAASQVQINAGTLRLGASERLSDAAAVSVASGATFNVNGAIERIGALFGTGNVDVGAGRLTFGGVESGFGGRLSGSGQLVHTGGLFTLLGDHTIGSISNTGGELRFAGTTTGGLSASGGSVTGAGTIGGALTASNGAVLSPGLAGVQNGIGGFTAGGLTLNGGTLAIDVLGRSGGNLIDQLRINGAATLTGGLLAPTFQGTASSFDFSTRYLFLQANNLVGTFANGSTFTAAAQDGLFWRVRYDLAPNAAVLELRQLTSFDPGIAGTGNQRAIGQALSGGQLGASDDWAAVISLIAGLSAAERSAALDSISGEPLADVTTTMFSANDTFLTAVRDGGLGGRNDGGEALNFVDSMSFIGGRENSADRLGDVLNAYDPSASTDRGSGGWVSAYAGDQTLEGKPGQADVESNLNGFAGGYGVRNGSLSLGGAGGVTRVEGDVAARQGHYESDLSHAAGYVAFDDGVWAADVSASIYGGDLDTRRGVNVGAFHGTAIGNTHVEGQALSASVARRFQVTDNTMIALGAIGTASNASVDGYTETGAGGLSLVASGQERDWQTLQLSARATQDYRVNGQAFRIYGGTGLMAMTGDRQATGDMRFSGAPVGFGSFVVEGAEAPPLAGLVDFGVEVGAGEGVTVSAGYRGLFSERLQDNQVGIKLQVSW